MIVSRNPLDASDILAEQATVDRREVEALAEQARRAQLEWALDPLGRSNALTRAATTIEANADGLVDLIVREVAKPVVEAEGEVARTAAILRYHAQAALAPTGDLLPPTDGRGLLMSRRSPRGLVGLITPFNFPLAIPTWKAAPALALGNAVLLKPSPLATATAARLVALLNEHLPAGILSLCAGEASAAMAVLSRVDALSFTGSTAAGTAIAIAAAGAHVPVQTENGGHNSAIVMADADPECVSRIVARDVVGYAGQKCTSTRRVLVCGDASAFGDALLAAIEALPVGHPAQREVVAGPVISAAAARTLQGAVGACRGAGLDVREVGDTRGHPYVLPTVVRDDEAVSVAAREELFGPVVVVQQVRDVRQAVSIVNAGAARLVAGVHTSDLDHALDVAQQLCVGLVRVNAGTTGVDLHASFGGEGESGYGPREQGRAADGLFTVERTITLRPAGRSHRT